MNNDIFMVFLGVALMGFGLGLLSVAYWWERELQREAEAEAERINWFQQR